MHARCAAPPAVSPIRRGGHAGGRGQTAHDGAVCLLTAPPASPPPQTYGYTGQVPERTNEVAGQYAAACKAVAAALRVPCLDLWAAFQAHPAWPAALVPDGLHPSPEGNALVLKELRALLDASFPHLRPEGMALDAPLHADLAGDGHAAHFAGFYEQRRQQDGAA